MGVENFASQNILWKHWFSKIWISFHINTETNVLQFSNQILKHCVLILLLKHIKADAYLLVMAADFRFHRRCADHRIFAYVVQILDDLFHTALKSLAAVDAHKFWLRCLTHANRRRCNPQSFCNTAKHLSVFIFQCSLLPSTPPHICPKWSSGHGIAIAFNFLYCVPLWRFVETSARRLCRQFKLIQLYNKRVK